jgi:cation diffusion facilitator family transporter
MTEKAGVAEFADLSLLIRYVRLMLAVTTGVIAFKLVAYLITGSIGLLSDTLESASNLVSGFIGLAALILASRPPDVDHEYGHGKFEYVSSSAQAGMILFTALSIAAPSISRLLQPQPLERPGIGLVIAAASIAINLVTAMILRRAGRENRSITLEANATTLLSDIWTTVGVIVGVVAVVATGWHWLDPMIGLGIAGYVVFTGAKLLRRSMLGLTDTALPEAEAAPIRAILDSYRADGVQYHALRTRQAGTRSFMTVHVLVPGTWTVRRGHSLLERIEHDIREQHPHVHITTHLEPLDDPTSWQDVGLERSTEGKSR